ncbi:MAG: hypothetical protein EPO26_03315 [Chloroflexota bacterium]|nr:MAG: hypothetical protein EPO26_03315 [Chloroflexota bacterium]
MSLRRRALVVLAFIAGLIALGGAQFIAPDEAEAQTRVRPRISWFSSLPRNLVDRSRILTDQAEPTRIAMQSEPLVFFRGDTLSRQSNPDPVATPVEPGMTFEDRVTFVPSNDVRNAVIRVHQPDYGSSTDDCHVVITDVSYSVAPEVYVPVGEPVPVGGATELDLGFLPQASAPYRVTILSQVPVASQIAGSRTTPKVYTSVIRLGHRIPSRSSKLAPGAPPTPTPVSHTCSGEKGGRGFSSLTRAVVVRTAIDPRTWAIKNGRATPTAIAGR